MEAEGLVEVFQESWEKHQMVYKNFVGDGDSSSFGAILKANPYAKFDVTVKKLSCTNHKLKNHTKYCKKVNPQFPRTKKTFATKARKIVVKKGSKYY